MFLIHRQYPLSTSIHDLYSDLMAYIVRSSNAPTKIATERPICFDQQEALWKVHKSIVVRSGLFMSIGLQEDFLDSIPTVPINK